MSLKLSIPERCHEDWQKMEPNKEGRHCLSCQKTVVDFSMMTDKEILDYISKAGANICGRVDDHQLNRTLQENKPRKRFSWMYIWNMILLSLLWTSKAKAQGGIMLKKVEQPVEVRPVVVGKMMFPGSDMPAITGRVFDNKTGEPVPFATISMKKGPVISANSEGRFSFDHSSRKSVTLTVTAIGYGTQKISVGKNAGGVPIFLQREATELEPVEVISFIPKTISCSTTTGNMTSLSGGITMSEKVTTTEKVSRVWNNLFAKKDIIVYPNPLPPGNIMKVTVQLKETGQYRMELIDAGGKIVSIQSVNIPSKEYNLSIPTQHTWSAGVYWLRISGTHTRNIYNSKVVIQ